MEAPTVRKTVALESSHKGASTGLQDSMRRLEIGDGGSSLPERPGEADCVYYLRNGSCGYGDRCRYNHPRGNSSLLLGAGEFPERPGQPVCEYYMKNGSCKFGSACKYNHPKQASGSAQQIVTLNSLGFPLRPGEKECNYYLKTGSCKYNSACKFHHPERALTTQVPSSAPVPMNYSSVQSSSLITPVLYPPLPSLNMNLDVGRYPVPPRNYGAMLMPAPGWNPYLGSISPLLAPSAQQLVQATPFYNLQQQVPPPVPHNPYEVPPLPVVPSLMGPTCSGPRDQFSLLPQRPGQAECHHFINKGYCKYGTSCRYHHPVPSDLNLQRTNCVLSPIGLPLRPGAQPCNYYAKHGVCKYGPTCKFDHPMGTLSYTPSTSSLSALSDLPIFPVNLPYSTTATGDIQPDNFNGTEPVSPQLTFSVTVSSCGSTAPVSVGSSISN
ncbi:zinc finger CCCH domain-containing protein 6-like isoform X1 [Carex littledalei]|uniref:Zinc finger CCCH domain-containing protein 6-like isoform X1 n=1 Tax=Carex littledalei TaxID=544730 RepID=A0A833QPK8_9POAL|nr:zinc finger CCCH domain-containing protein 6-like isoform X1 [Carex littledalei]